MVSAQAQYHRNALARLEVLVPRMKEVLDNHNRKPVFGTHLEEHLESEGVKIAVPLRICVEWLQEFGIGEEGLFRIAGSAGKVKVLRVMFNCVLGSGKLFVLLFLYCLIEFLTCLFFM